MAMDYWCENGDPLVKRPEGLAVQRAIRKLYLVSFY
jgi:hypothetical protein